MLHILLLILKIIGIILAVVLGIIILLLSIVLFVPIRYEISAKCDGTIESLRAKLKATWILHLLCADMLVKGNKLKWQLKVVWIKKSSAMVLGGQKEKSSDEVSEKTEASSETVEDNQWNESLQGIKDEPEHENNLENKEDIPDTTCDVSENKSFADKIKERYEHVKTTLEELLEKKEKVTDFLTDEAHVCAFKKIKKELSVLLNKLKPKRINIKLKFGFDDPCVTGKVLGILSILYPFLGDTTDITPDFEKQILKGNVYIKGQIRISHFVNMVVKLLICREVRTSYKDIKNFKI